MFKMNQIKLIKTLREVKIRKARESFWEFCKVMSPILQDGTPLYHDGATYLKDLAETLQNLVENKFITESGDIAEGVCISMPPRHGKSYTVNLFSRWYLGKYENKRIINLSYSQKLTNQFSREIRNEIKNQKKGKFDVITFSDVFPNLSISSDQKSAEKWSLEGTTHQFTFATASFRTSITGLGADLGIVDDPVKNSEEAMSEKALEDKWNLFTNTFISRVEMGGKWIIIQTRWSQDDIIGKIKDHEIFGKKFKFIELKVVEETNKGLKFLNPSIFDMEQYITKKSLLLPLIFEANYNQKIIDMQIALYNNWKKYEEFPEDEDYKIVGVLDPSADGKDYTALLVGRFYEKLGEIYLIDIFYNDAPITKIEDNLYDFIDKSNLNELIIESNGAFSILTNNIRKEMKKRGNKVKVIKFNQTKNKETRILTASNACQATIFFMPDFEQNYNDVYQHFIKFKSIIKDNKHDDFEDAYTMMWEKYISGKGKNKLKKWEKRFYM